MTVNIYMVRHGETYFNLLHRFQGWSDAPLTEKGIQDGYAAGTRLANVHFDGAYSSGLTRTIHTSQYILVNNKSDSLLVLIKMIPSQIFPMLSLNMVCLQQWI